MQNLKIGTRLSLGFAVISVPKVSITRTGIWRLNNTKSASSSLVTFFAKFAEK